MIPAGFDYLRPATITEALQMASRHEGAQFLAGGHALLPEWKLRHKRSSTLIDLGRIAELRGIEIRGTVVRIRSSATGPPSAGHWQRPARAATGPRSS